MSAPKTTLHANSGRKGEAMITISVADLHPEAKKTILEQAYYVHPDIQTCSIREDELVIRFKAGVDIPSDISNSFEKLVSETAQSFSKVEILEVTANDGAATYSKDPHEEFVASGQYKEVGNGVAVMRGPLLHLIRSLDSLFFRFALNQLQAEEHEIGTTVRTETLYRCGYLSSFPQHAIFASPLQSDINRLDTLSNAASKGLPIENLPWETMVDRPQQVLTPTVCYPLFEFLRGEILPNDGLSITALAKCHRHENKNTQGLSRLQTFSMREFVFWGSADYVREQLTASQDYAVELLEKWDVGFVLQTACDPFFGGTVANKRFFQNFMKMKLELRMNLPYADDTISVGSFNNHADSLTSKFDIAMDSDEKCCSGCVGFGYERFALALMAQFGTDITTWPQRIREDLF